MEIIDKETLEKFRRAGKIAAEAREHGRKLIKEGALASEIAEAVEKKIIFLGGKLAFPLNISINDIAAHWTPPAADRTTIKAGDYVKIDVGDHIDGYLADTAITVRVAGKDNLIKCCEKMLEVGTSLFKPGVSISEIGEAIESVSKEFGFNSVRNLCGHSIDRHMVHAGMTIQNIKNDNKYQLRENEVYACEPFCTPGNGFVKDSGAAQIFRWLADRPTRMIEARKILELGKIKFERLPFAKRWVQKEISGAKVELALKQLIEMNAIYPYYPLREVSNAAVAQAEHTIIVKEKPIIITEI